MGSDRRKFSNFRDANGISRVTPQTLPAILFQDS